MSIFTQNCKKYNISLAEDAITFYPQKTGIKKRGIHRTLDKQVVIIEVDTYFNEVDKLSDLVLQTRLGGARFIQRDDEKHDTYHNDSFNPDDTHHHLKFPYLINENNLPKILAVLVEYQILSSIERDLFLAAYQKYRMTITSKKDSPYSAVAEAQMSHMSVIDVAKEGEFLDTVEKNTEKKTTHSWSFFPVKVDLDTKKKVSLDYIQTSLT
ncbi:hypothetical protein [Legionella hackeliae]|uniref:Uncharacterized protein n=1 Tax=Legionella hackeliae TaxID=449 RepID=A0A0A8UMW3_LEGHA|nr:hypothetical protein [Legionella hackeliae]KTD08766.1 hypothetical protein Lhac_2989 [Legionella hackeliae]CEK10195.1 protein of unknown function [Legionella hackeliae]STX46919.1 Uncharacterised protein [Legionella hackeliae]